ncbi:glycosyltransferase family 4 protein [Mucilaginibacter sp. BT774]|uniref:glycosyltransferase family 4 protein n=1 Tax=Mucilaginibacter sp. BT774 TaxID=3062276 RepID=UPI00267648AD|nr:glycosyltransferase family 4 protein [Mucilaginibacter sp. BT774]MDO3628852.1 glycosyltransferase family 4 protein [Mucilaginibacter sp. BT774]
MKINAEVFQSPARWPINLRIINNKQKQFLKGKYEEHRPALIHGHFLTDTSYFHPFTKNIAIPKICSAYGYDVSRFPQYFFGLGRFYLQRVFDSYDRFLAMSDDMANDLVLMGCPQKKIRIHYHGIDTQLFNVERTYEDSDVYNILTIASLVPKKGHLTVLKSLATLKKMRPQLKVVYTVVGRGEMLESLEKFVAENGLRENVTFKGHIKHGDEFLKILAQADVFVHPSVTDKRGDKEGIPGTIVQAMASGLPVIATHHAGIPDVIRANWNGLLIKENDDLQLAEFLSELSANSDKRKFLGENALNTAINELDIRKKTKELVNIYKKELSVY